MRALVFLLAALATACSSTSAPSPGTPAPAPADLVITGATIATMNPNAPRAEAIAIRGERIVYVGDVAHATELRGPDTRVVALEGGMVLPGFHDGHVHPVTGGIELGQCNLNDASTEADVRKRILEYAAAHAGDAWIVGGGWDLPLFPGGNPNKALLDELVPDRPAFLSAADGHSAWVNSAALAAAGIDAQTADPVNGRIERDANGAPSGTLRESAMDLVGKHVPELTADDYVHGLERGMAMANRFGITSWQEASAGKKVLAAYHTLAKRGALKARVVAAQHVDLSRGVEQISELAERAEALRTERFRPTSAKIFADGVIEAGTAALLTPYVGTDSRGKLNIEAEQLEKLVVALDKAGLDVHIHAIGDRAIRASLDAFAATRAVNGDRGRHTIAHLQLIDPADIPRFAKLRVAANFQALWAQADPYIVKLTEPVLGPERSRWLYPIRSVADTGAIVVGGSDWSVSSMNPLAAIEVAITRKPTDEPAAGAWIPQERIDLDTALVAYTRAGAYLNRQENEVGTLEVGKRADLVLLERDLYAIPSSEIGEVKVLATLIDGQAVYCQPAVCERLASH